MQAFRVIILQIGDLLPRFSINFDNTLIFNSTSNKLLMKQAGKHDYLNKVYICVESDFQIFIRQTG